MSDKPKASDAMRLADLMELPNLREQFIERDVASWKGEKPPCCAIAGANIAIGYVRIVPEDGEVTDEQAGAVAGWDHFAENFNAPVPRCPECTQRRQWFLGGVVLHLYDNHNWSRTQVADWLDTLEAASVSA